MITISEKAKAIAALHTEYESLVKEASALSTQQMVILEKMTAIENTIQGIMNNEQERYYGRRTAF